MDKHILAAVGFVLLLASCNELKEADLLSGNPISFAASVGEYSTRATDTAFEKGDMVGLFAASPLNLDNVPLTAIGGGAGLTSEKPLYWDCDQTEATSFKAYYPYDKNLKLSGEELLFSIESDQSTKEGYGASDFMFASTSASPADESVSLVFGHKLSKLSISIDNQSGDTIGDVSIEGVMTEVAIDAANGLPLGSSHADQSAVVVKPFVVRDSSKVTLSCIVPPQKSELLLSVTMGDGSVRSFLTSADLTSGRQHRGEIALDSSLDPKMEFSLSVEDWEYGGTLDFYDGQQGPRTGWTIYYDRMSADGSKVEEKTIRMEETSRGVYSACIKDYRSKDSFILISDNDWYIYGCKLAYPQSSGVNNDEWPVSNGGKFRLSDYDGDLYVNFMPDEGILRYEYPQWENIGGGEYVTGISSALQSLNGNYDDPNIVPKIEEVDIFEDSRQPGVYRVRFVDGYKNLIIDASDTSRVYLKSNDSGPYGCSLESPVAENRVSGYDGSVYGKVRDGVVTLPLLMKTEKDSTVVFETPDWQLVLPGYKRNPVLGFKFGYRGCGLRWNAEQNKETLYAAFRLILYPDMENLRYTLFSGFPTTEEFDMDILPDLKAGKNCETITDGSSHEMFYIPITKTGSYTAFFYADAPSVSDYWRYYYLKFTVCVDGSDAPAANLNLSGAAPHNLFPEKVAKVHVDFPNANWLGVRVIEKAAADAGGLKEEDYYSFASENTVLKSYMINYLSDKSGMDVAIEGLEPDTEYLIVAAGTDRFKQADWAAATVKTGSAPTQWEEVGTGEWIDGSFFIDKSVVSDNEYRSPVTIQKAVGTERYRAVRPYAAYWEACGGNPAGGFGHAGYDSDFDFAFVEDEGVSYICYAPYRPGFKVLEFAVEGTDAGCLEFSHHNISLGKPSIYNYTKYNREVQDGVYNIAPYVNILGTTYFYNHMAVSNGYRLVMPGHSFMETKAVHAPVVSPGPERGENVYIGAETELKPFKRKPIRFGDPVVVRSNDK